VSEARAAWTAREIGALIAHQPAGVADTRTVSSCQPGLVEPPDAGERPAGTVDLTSAILGTVVYSSLFDYPLTAGQVARTLVGARATDREVLRAYRASRALQGALDYRDGFFFPVGRPELVARRRLREQHARLLLRRHRHVLRLIGLLPWTRLVALSGSVAHLNVERDGDIDLFIVARHPRAWSVTLTIVLLTKALGCRPTFCANYVITDQALAVGRPDLFSANQIIHLRPIVDDGTFARFVAANPFIERFYPGFAPAGPLAGFAPGRVGRALKRMAEAVLSLGPGQILEAASRRIYGGYLRSKATHWQSPEQVELEADRLKLHGQSHRRAILRRYEEAIAAAERSSLRHADSAREDVEPTDHART